MTVQTLYTAATGMDALETKLDVVANNLANVNTTGFKRDRANFEDLIYRHYVEPGTEDAAGNLTAVGTKVGLGVRVSSVQTDFRQGALENTGRELDIAIEGKGFIQVKDVTGETIYTRGGNFNRNSEGSLVLGSAQVGRLVEPQITIPEDAVSVSISSDGTVSYRASGNSQPQEIGQITLASFINPEGLLKLGENLFAESAASGSPVVGTASENGLGTVRQGSLEASNVEPVRELIDLITTQRSFELNSQAVQAGDQVLQQISNLRRF